MLIFDYRDSSIKELSEERLSYIAPELYAFVFEGDFNYYVYRYVINNDETKYIDYNFTQEDVNSSKLSFDEMVNIFMNSNNVDKYYLSERRFYLTKETIQSAM